jgi:diguanylate cyclase (GGDEF)-like protein
MKIGKSETPSRSGGRSRSAAGAGKPSAKIETAPGIAGVLGIPEEELTPRVRSAITPLLQEVEHLRLEVEQARVRMEEMARAADQDMLLPVLNRRAFVREISRFIHFAERYGTPSSLLYFDLDDFKTVNDAHGHAAGDVVLRHFADLVAAQIRDSDILARIGGDEFAVILAHVTLEQAAKKGASLAQSLREQPPVWNGQTVHLSFSYGAYELHAGALADSAIAHADRAMYAQKRAGAKKA